MTSELPGLISVVLACRNGARFLKEQLDSILGQAGVDLELIACDDASTDATPAILEAYRARNPEKIRLLLHAEPRGMVGNFESGLREARGSYVALADQDDVWKPEKLRRLKEAIDGGARLAFCDMALVDEALRPLGGTMWDTLGFGRREKSLLATGRGFEVLLKRNVISGCALMCQASLIRDALPLPPLAEFVHDQWLALLACFTGTLDPIPEALVRYRQHASQMTGGQRSELSEIISAPRRERAVAAWDARWDRLFNRLGSLGVSAETLSLARRRVDRRFQALRTRDLGPTIASVWALLSSGAYVREFSGLKSCARDLFDLARRRKANP